MNRTIGSHVCVMLVLHKVFLLHYIKHVVHKYRIRNKQVKGTNKDKIKISSKRKKNWQWKNKQW